MPGLGTIVNVLAVLAGSIAGLALKKRLSARLTDAILQGLSLAVIIVGLSGAFEASFSVDDGSLSSQHVLIMIISLALGALIGTLIGIDGKLNRFAAFCEKKLSSGGGESAFAQGFMTATLVFCVGAMAVVGSLEDGINGNHDILFAKSAMDAIAAMVFASTLGFGVIFSAAAVGLYQGVITALAVVIAPYLDQALVAQMSLVGSVLIMAIGLNMLKITKIKIADMIPAIFIPVVYQIIKSIIPHI